MARKTTTVYTCDGCGKKVAKPADLRRFVVETWMLRREVPA